jgi:hypothetical protein
MRVKVYTMPTKKNFDRGLLSPPLPQELRVESQLDGPDRAIEQPPAAAPALPKMRGY